MSLAINMPKITRVLLADGWHECQGISIDAYEFGVYVWDREWGSNGYPRFRSEHAGGQSDVCATGFEFHDEDTAQTIAGPLTAILAVAGPGICANPEEDDPDVMGRPGVVP